MWPRVYCRDCNHFGGHASGCAYVNGLERDLAIVLVVEEALHNVPRVGEVYNQQMSDHHMQALLALSKYKADRGLDALEQTRNNDDVEIGLG